MPGPPKKMRDVYSAADLQHALTVSVAMIPTVMPAAYSVAGYPNQERVLSVDRRHDGSYLDSGA